MTTVVYRDGVLAFDSRVSEGGTHFGQVYKGRQTKNFIMAGCGDLEDVYRAMDWIEAGMQEDKKKDFGIHSDLNCSVVVADKNGDVLVFDSKVYGFEVDHPWIAIGSGADVARGALEAGVSAKEAVQIAAKYDLFTGGTIRTLSVKSLWVKPVSKKVVKKKQAKKKVRRK